MSRQRDVTSHSKLQLGEEAPSDFRELQRLNRTMEKVSLTEEPRQSASDSSLPQCVEEAQNPESLETEEPVLTEPDQQELNDPLQKVIGLKVQLLYALMDKDYTLVRQLCQMILVYDPNNQEAAHILNTMRQGQATVNNESDDEAQDSGGDEDESEQEESSEDDDDSDGDSDEDGSGDCNSRRENQDDDDDDDDEDEDGEVEENCEAHLSQQ